MPHHSYAKLVLKNARSAWKDHVGRASGDNDEIDFVPVDACRSNGALACLEREIAGHLFVGGNMALANAGAAHDPFVAGIDDFLQITIREHFVREVTPGAYDARIIHAALPGTERDCSDLNKRSWCRRSASLLMRSSNPWLTSDSARSSAL